MAATQHALSPEPANAMTPPAVSSRRLDEVRTVRGPEPAAVPAPDASLTERIRAKLSELEGRGYTIRWISAPTDALVTLFVEGGEQAILMDPDPGRDVAWFGVHEIRPSENAGVWVYIEGEHPEMSRHHI